MALVQNDVTETVPGSGTVRLAMDFGNLPEIEAGDLIDTCTISILPVTSPALTIVSLSTVISGGYLVSAAFTGGTAATYTVTFTPTLESGQQLPPRTGNLILKASP